MKASPAGSGTAGIPVISRRYHARGEALRRSSTAYHFPLAESKAMSVRKSAPVVPVCVRKTLSPVTGLI